MRNIMQKFARAVAFGIVLGSATISSAQAQQGPTVTESQTFGSWSVRCYHDAPFVCDMTQVDIDRAHNVLVASIAISYDPKSDSYLGRFMMPLGVSFDQGLGLQIGPFNAPNIKFRVCAREGCLVLSPLPPQLIQAMQAGGARGSMKATLITGRQIQIPVLLDGFSEGLDLLKKKTAEKLAEKK
jgi:invasion protein IalB